MDNDEFKLVQNKRRRSKRNDPVASGQLPAQSNPMPAVKNPVPAAESPACVRSATKAGQQARTKDPVVAKETRTDDAAPSATSTAAKARPRKTRKSAAPNNSAANANEFVTNLIDSKQWPKLKDEKPSRKKEPKIGKKAGDEPKKGAEKAGDQPKVSAWSQVLGGTRTETPSPAEPVASPPLEIGSSSSETGAEQQPTVDGSEDRVAGEHEAAAGNDARLPEEHAEPAVKASENAAVTAEGAAPKPASKSQNAASRKNRNERNANLFEVYNKDVLYFDNLSANRNYDDELCCGQIVGTKPGIRYDANGNYVEQAVYSIPSRNPNIYYYFDGTMKDLRARLCHEIETLFDAEHLLSDRFLAGYVDEHGWVPLQIVASHRTVQKLTNDLGLLASAIALSDTLETNETDFRVRNSQWSACDQRASVASGDYRTTDKCNNSSYLYCPVPTLHLDDVMPPKLMPARPSRAPFFAHFRRH